MPGDANERPASIPVKAVVRGRPLIQKEIEEGCQTCLEFISNANQVILGDNRAFTFDHVFSGDVGQEEVYNTSVKGLTRDIFKGYHASVIAYGQTGSGKTYSMGSAHSTADCEDESTGVIPRVISDIFALISQDKERQYTVKVSYLELYKKELHDLLCTNADRPQLTIRDAPDCGTVVNGLSEILVTSSSSTLLLMEQGNLNRTTAATAMNSVSSRSHAIFTILLESVSVHDVNDKISSKFHLVDLAGSERVKRTKAEGERLQEGIKINEGLLALGNVISTLADENARSGHIKYRDSKLTRILQGSLGGNSHTLMIACVSPADSNFEETLNTLRYADRVRKIKNAPVVNRDPQTMLIASLKKENHELRLRLLEKGGGPITCSAPGSLTTENSAKLLEENERIKAENVSLSEHLQQALEYQADMCEKVILTEMSRDLYKEKLINITDIAKSISQKFSNFETSYDTLDSVLKLELFTQLIKLCKSTLEVKFDDNVISEVTMHSHSIHDTKQADVIVGDVHAEDGSEETQNNLGMGHAMKNADLGKQLRALTKTLALKEETAKKLASNDSQMAAIKNQYEKKLQELDQDIQNLTHEKANLEQALANARKTNESKKLSEKRRQRVCELEAQIQGLRKEKLEKEKLLRIKADNDRSIQRLNTEILEMKRSRVNLMKQMRAENEKFNNLRKEKTKELKQLQEKNRKRNVEYVKLERTYDKQKAILRRKTEEAAAANKRLREALNKQTAAAAKRRQTERSFKENGGVKVKNFLDEEIELAMSIWEAEHHLTLLLDDRKMLAQELQNTDSPNKRRRTFDANDRRPSVEKRHEVQQEIKLKNAQIQAIQTKLSEAKERHTSNQRWSTISTFADVKFGLKTALQRIIDEKIKLSKMEEKLQGLETRTKQLNSALNASEKQVQQLTNKYEEEKSGMERSHQEQLSFYINKFGSSGSDVPVESLQNMIVEQKERILNLEEEKKILHKRLLESEVKIPKKRARFFKPVSSAELFAPDNGAVHDDDEDDFLDDNAAMDEDYVPTPEVSRKMRQIAKLGCSCRRTKKPCKDGICGCKKKGNKCGNFCRCSELSCCNRPELPDSTRDGDSPTTSHMESTGNSTFDASKEINLADERKLLSKPSLYSPNKENSDDIIPRTPLENVERSRSRISLQDSGKYRPLYFSSPLSDKN